MTAARLSLVEMVAVAALINPCREHFAWLIRLRRTAWLTHEGLIPLIWLTIYACFYALALLRTTRPRILLEKAAVLKLDNPEIY
jgi:tryptophan-rich sensory protein